MESYQRAQSVVRSKANGAKAPARSGLKVPFATPRATTPRAGPVRRIFWPAFPSFSSSVASNQMPLQPPE
ncbi:MAG TPA: hypothetical protein VNH84_21865, partial [Candidatus Saccharimonadales bacterium]|nr:hypothetical protein [Candidatus Saccharimonadales bacterium]